MQQAIAVENHDQERKPRMASRLEEDDCMYDQFRNDRARMIGESDARLLEVQRQEVAEIVRYADHGRLRVIEIQDLHRVLHQVDRNAHESQNAALLDTEELAPAQAQSVGTLPRVATPPPTLVGSSRPEMNASPRRQANLFPPTNPDGEAPRYDREEDLKREELATVEGWNPPKHRRCGEEAAFNDSGHKFTDDCSKAATPTMLSYSCRVER